MGIASDLQINGRNILMEKVDDFTIRFVAPESAALFDWTYLAFQEQAWARYGEGGYAPAHYLQQFHPNYIGEAKANKIANDAGTKDWRQHFLSYLSDWELNPDLPVVMPWKIMRGRELHRPLRPRAKPLQHLGRHRRQPAALHRVDHVRRCGRRGVPASQPHVGRLRLSGELPGRQQAPAAA